MNLLQWLDERVLKRIAELVAVNGGWTIQEIGQSEPTDQNRYGRKRLNIREALELAFLDGAYKALANAFPDQKQRADEMLEREIRGETVTIFSIADLRRLEDACRGVHGLRK